MSNKRKMILITLAVVLPICAIIAGCVFFMGLLLCSKTKVLTSDSKDFQGREQLIEIAGPDILGRLLVFPEMDYQSMKIEEFYHEEVATSFNTIYEIAISYTLNEQEFEAEKERIAGIRAGAEGKEHKIVFSSKVFSYPAYVSVFTGNTVREYALIDEENNRIICVYNQFSDEKTGELDKSYLPTAFKPEDMSAECRAFMGMSEMMKKNDSKRIFCIVGITISAVVCTMIVVLAIFGWLFFQRYNKNGISRGIPISINRDIGVVHVGESEGYTVYTYQLEEPYFIDVRAEYHPMPEALKQGDVTLSDMVKTLRKVEDTEEKKVYAAENYQIILKEKEKECFITPLGVNEMKDI